MADHTETHAPSNTAPRRLIAGVALLLALASPAFGQQGCAALQGEISRIEASPAFANLAGARHQVDQARTRLADAQGQFDRAGCQSQLQAGGLDAACTAYSGAILRAQSDVQQVEFAIGDADAMAGQRQALIDAYGAQGCGGGSAVTFSTPEGPDTGMRSLLGNTYDPQTSAGFLGPEDDPDLRGTRRTLCVRTCDGSYWPVSYSTTQSYMAQDAQTCRAQCPGAEVTLYSHANPGEDVSDMVSAGGLRYADQPFAFAFREDAAPTCSCALGAAGFSDVGVSGIASIPSPDNRDLVDVPLPMPRPVFPGEAPPVTAQGPSVPVEELRLYESGDRVIRIVGPVTAYTPEAAEAF